MLVWPTKKALILKSKTPDKILNVVPSAKSFSVKGQPLVAVPHRTEETTLLRNLGYDAPAPIRSYYDWPGRFKPFHAQREAAAFLSMNKRAFNLSELGTRAGLPKNWAKAKQKKKKKQRSRKHDKDRCNDLRAWIPIPSCSR